jgi:hypothetical protein
LSKITRVSGILLLVGGVLVAISWSFHPLDPDPHTMQSTRWLVVHGLAGIGLALTVPGLLGLYNRLAAESGVGGLIGFILAAVGTALMAGTILFIEVGTLPLIATLPNAEEVLNTFPPAFMAVFGVTLLTFILGYILLGIVTWRSAVLPRTAGLLLLVGAPLFAAPAPPTPIIVNTIGAILFGLGYAWLGYSLWANTSQLIEAPAQVQPASLTQ